ncbi:MAG: hypothetical protein BWY29_01081 [Microgenomates group bacterium ADurb.Bin238]|nr:MAG: hypothetical protein BWY29_01081 [Microgenomates group bacterium ADurb.Bin238]
MYDPELIISLSLQVTILKLMLGMSIMANILQLLIMMGLGEKEIKLRKKWGLFR